jgi:hypothetical protein
MDPEERARLQAVAYGPDADPRAAADAARALAADRGVRGAPVVPAPLAEPAGSREPAPDLPADVPPLVDAADGRDGARPRRRRRSVLLVAAVAVLAFGLGVGATNAATHLPTRIAGSGPTSSTAELTDLARVLGRAQATDDRLPATLRDGVVASTSRLVFANSAASPSTPWSAWVATTRAGDLCVIASPNGSDATRSCLTHATAFDGTATLVARSGSDRLTVIITDGIVDVELAGSG